MSVGSAKYGGIPVPDAPIRTLFAVPMTPGSGGEMPVPVGKL